MNQSNPYHGPCVMLTLRESHLVRNTLSRSLAAVGCLAADAALARGVMSKCDAAAAAHPSFRTPTK